MSRGEEMSHPLTISSRRKNMETQDYDITLLQTPRIGQKKGYRSVYRLNVDATCHDEAMYEVFRRFNVKELMPKDTEARYIRTGDILYFDEGLAGMTYYKLQPEGWKKIGRVHVR
jgi:cupin superfamily acireductone dioxygenase involved in methionine salvage